KAPLIKKSMRELFVSLVLLSSLAVTRAQDAAQEAPPPRIYRDKVQAHWFADNNKFWYRNDLPGGRREFILVDAEQGTRRAAFDHQRVAKVLREKLNKEIDPERLPFEAIRFSDDGKSIRLIGEESWSISFEDYGATEDKTEKPEKT